VKPASLWEHLESLPDPRAERNRKHLLVDVVAIGVCGVLVDRDGPTAIRLWAEQRADRRRGFLTPPEGLPPKDSLRRVLSRLKGQGLGRIERRVDHQTPLSEELKPLASEWEGLATIGQVISITERDGNETSEVRYDLSRLPPGVQRFAEAVRGHWTIENSRHWVLDVTFREDDSRSRDRLLAQNLAALRRRRSDSSSSTPPSTASAAHNASPDRTATSSHKSLYCKPLNGRWPWEQTSATGHGIVRINAGASKN
jgi:predicted transposase YbfD/YdcC